MTAELIEAFNIKKYPIHTKYPPRSKFHSVSVYDQPFSRYKVVKIANVPNDPRMTLSI